MARLCERPGCSEVAAVAYGMQPEDLVFWLDAVRPGEEHEGGRLCTMHADSMVVPRNWTLNDLRDPDLHLFRPPPIERPPKRRARRSHRDDTPTGIEQLSLTVAADEVIERSQPGSSTESSDNSGFDGPVGQDPDDEPRATTRGAGEGDGQRDEGGAVERTDGRDGEATSWRPDFDSGDDLDGLLSARSPLLARAFRGRERRR